MTFLALFGARKAIGHVDLAAFVEVHIVGVGFGDVKLLELLGGGAAGTTLQASPLRPGSAAKSTARVFVRDARTAWRAGGCTLGRADHSNHGAQHDQRAGTVEKLHCYAARAPGTVFVKGGSCVQKVCCKERGAVEKARRVYLTATIDW